MGTLPDEAYAAALATLPGAGPRVLRRWLDDGAPGDVWSRLSAGTGAPPMVAAARSADVGAIWSVHRRHGITVCLRGRPPYPACLADDLEAPAVLFALGDPAAADHFPRVAVVGTRTPTRYGLGVAAQLGADLAAAGVAVVSGLALGIDGAAHEGAAVVWEGARSPDRCDVSNGSQPAGATQDGAPSIGPAPPLAVVAGGLDRAYPRRHALLWERVARSGAVLSEAPVGTADLGWRFPQRNRILAALAEVVVVVECHATGGSLHTVQAAVRRGVTVGAVPGSVRSPASAGTNDLLADGCIVVRDTTDVLVALGLARPIAPRRSPVTGPGDKGVATLFDPPAGSGAQGASGIHDAHDAHDTHDVRTAGTARTATGGTARTATADTARTATGVGGVATGVVLEDPTVRRVLEVLEWDPCPLDDVLDRTGLDLGAAAGALERLRAAGAARGDGGWWART